MLLSIIIPAFNAEKYIKEAIDSALSQDIPKDTFEVIVVNDGSDDSTETICLEYGTKIRYFYKPNGGTASALNTGISFATGDFIKWLSADDVLLPDAVRKMITWISENDYDNWEKTIYYTHYHIIDKDGEFLRDFKEPERTTADLWKLFYGNGSSSLIHSKVFKKCGLFDATLRHSEDYEMWLRCTQLFEIKLTLIPLFTLNYRNHPDQLTHKVGGSNDKMIKESVKSKMV